VSGLIRSKNPQAVLSLPKGLTVRKVYDRLIFSLGKGQSIANFSYRAPGPGTIYLEALDRTLRFEEIEGGMDLLEGDDENTACLDADRVQYPLIIRNFRPGDRFVPLGMKGHRKIKDLFIDLKVPSETRALTPLLTSRDNIVWVCGYRVDDRYKVTDDTKKVLKVIIQ
ncbi:MAG: tRNA lysidine(34) synthetase TilS, partial [Deltaproteobacteria bacterium]